MRWTAGTHAGVAAEVAAVAAGGTFLVTALVVLIVVEIGACHDLISGCPLVVALNSAALPSDFNSSQGEGRAFKSRYRLH